MKKQLACTILFVTLIIVVVGCAVLYALIMQPWRDPVSLVFPLARNQTTDFDIPLVLPRGSYYVQVLFSKEYLESLQSVAVFGSIEINTNGKPIYRSEIKLELKSEDIKCAINDAALHEEIARRSQRGVQNLPYPWTTIIPGTVSLPQFPQFQIPDKNTLLNVRISMESRDKELSQKVFSESTPIAIRIDSFFDAI